MLQRIKDAWAAYWSQQDRIERHLSTIENQNHQMLEQIRIITLYLKQKK